LSVSQAREEIEGSKAALQAIGINPVSTFVYPLGEYNNSVVQLVKEAGYLGARTVERGYNTKVSDRYALKEQEIDASTVFADAKSWIDSAKASKTWLILTFHQVDYTGSYYGNTPELLQQVIDYIKASGIDVVTLKDGIARMDQ
jgi:peptidoglycan/xylan/chitin deacetylase (PgdA/CDA1 family)